MGDVDQSGLVDLRRSAGDRYGILIMLALMLFAVLVPVAGAVILWSESAGAALFLLAIGLFAGAMTALVLNEALIRWRTRIRIDGDTVHLSLPGRRSYVPQPPVERSIRVADIRDVQTRAEAFRAAGNTVLQQVYSIVVNDGTRIVLGADRRMVAPFFGEVAGILAGRTGKAIEDLGFVDGNPGRLMFWGQTVPGWDAQALPPEAAETRVRQEQRAWQLVSIVVFVVLLVRVLVAMLR